MNHRDTRYVDHLITEASNGGIIQQGVNKRRNCENLVVLHSCNETELCSFKIDAFLQQQQMNQFL